MSSGEFVKLECRPGAIKALASRIDRFGAAEGLADWLVSAVWLRTNEADFLASSSTKVLSDGYIARPLSIQEVGEFERQASAELVDISGRLIARQSSANLPPAEKPRPPAILHAFGSGPYSTSIVIRLCARRSTTHRVACGLMFELENRRLLVGTDIATLAMVLSDDKDLIDRYLASCQSLPAADYLASYEN